MEVGEEPRVPGRVTRELGSVCLERWSAWARSSLQPLDLCLLSPTTSAYSAMRSAPDSHLINDSQPLDQHLSTTLSSPVSRLISAVSRFIIT